MLAYCPEGTRALTPSGAYSHLRAAALRDANFTLIVNDANHTNLQQVSKEYLSDEGYALMGAAFEVHREIGCGLSEDGARQRGDGESKYFAPKG